MRSLDPVHCRGLWTGCQFFRLPSLDTLYSNAKIQMNGGSTVLEYWIFTISSLRSDKRGLQVLKKRGIANHHRARQVHEDDFRRFDVIMAFDDSNVEDLNESFKPNDGTARAEVKLFGTYDPKGERIIHDPYYGDVSDFDVMFDHIHRCCVEFLRQS